MWKLNNQCLHCVSDSPGDVQRACLQREQLNNQCLHCVSDSPGDVQRACLQREQLNNQCLHCVSDSPGDVQRACLQREQLNNQCLHCVSDSTGDVQRACLQREQLNNQCLHCISDSPGDVQRACLQREQLNNQCLHCVSDSPGDVQRACLQREQSKLNVCQATTRCGRDSMDIKTDDKFARNDCDTTINDDNNHIQFPQSHLASSEKHCGRNIHAYEHPHSKDITSVGSGVVSASLALTSIRNDMVGNEENHVNLMKKDYEQNISPAEALTPHNSSNYVDAQDVMYNTVAYEAAGDSRDASSMGGVQGGSTKIHFSAGVNKSIPEQIKEDIGCRTAAEQVAQPLGTHNREKAGVVEDGPSCCSESNEVTSVTVTQELVSEGTGNNSGNETHEVGISTGMLTETSVINDQSASTSDRRGLPNSRCTTDILESGITARIDGTDILPETVESTKTPCDEDSDPILQLPICYEGGIVSKQVASVISVEEPHIQPTNESQPLVHSTQQYLNGVAADDASIYEDGYGHLLKNDGMPPEPVRVNSLRAEEMCITAHHSDCVPFCSQTLLTKEEQAPVTQESDFYLTPLAVAPQLESLPMELECNSKSDTHSVEVFEADSHSQVNVDISCIHHDSKSEERTMNIDKVCDVHQQSVAGLENSSLQREGKKEDSQRSDLDICNINHQSVVDLEMPCIDCEGRLEDRTTQQLEVFRSGDQQFVIGVDISSTESGGKLEEGTINKTDQPPVPDVGTCCIEPEDKLKERPIDKPEVFEMDQQSVIDLGTSCIEPEDKLEEKPIDKPEVFEMDQQSVIDLGTCCIEPEDKLEERPIDKPEVFEMDQQSVIDLGTCCIEPEDKLEERPIDKPEVFEMDQQSVIDLGTCCIEPEDKLEERPIDKPEVFEMDQQSVIDLGTYCIEPEDKLEERPIDKPEVFEMDQQSVIGLGTSCIEPEDKLEEKPIDKPEVFEMDQQSVIGLGTSCIEPEDKLEEKPIDKPEVFEMDQQSVIDVGISCIESENKFDTRQKHSIESYNMDQQLVPDLEMCCIEPEGKLEQKPIYKTDVFEINQQLVPNVDISGIELEEKLEERSVEMTEEVYDLDQPFVRDQVISSCGYDGNVERRPVSKPRVSGVDQQSTVERTTCCDASEGKIEDRSESNKQTFLFDQQLSCQSHSAEETNQKHLVKQLETGMLNENPPDDGGGVSMPTVLKHSDRHDRRAQDDQYTKIKSCFHTATVVQFASPLVSYIEYSNDESSGSSEDTQDAMEIVPYLHNDTMSNFTFDNKSWVVDDDMRTVEKAVSHSRSAVKESASESNGNLKHRTYSDAVNNSDTIVTSLDGAQSSTHATNWGIGVNVQIKEETCVTNDYLSCENCDINDCNCGKYDTFEAILNKQQEGKESDQQEQTCTVAEPREECLIMRHSHSIKEDVDGCMNDLLEAVYLQIDASDMSIFRTEGDVPPDATDATNVCCDAASKDTNQQLKNNIPIENEANIMYEEMSIDITGCLAPNYDRVKQIIAKRDNECFVTTASLNGDHTIQKEADSDPESYIPSKFRKLAVGRSEDMDSCHTEPATELQENASYGDGQYSRWIKKGIRIDAEDQQVPKDDGAHASLQQEESLYRGRCLDILRTLTDVSKRCLAIFNEHNGSWSSFYSSQHVSSKCVLFIQLRKLSPSFVQALSHAQAACNGNFFTPNCGLELYT